jgi:hypothetical protein
MCLCDTPRFTFGATNLLWAGVLPVPPRHWPRCVDAVDESASSPSDNAAMAATFKNLSRFTRMIRIFSGPARFCERHRS